MKIARLVFIIVLLASAIVVPNRYASANVNPNVTVTIGTPTIDAVTGLLSYPVRVTFAANVTQRTKYVAVLRFANYDYAVQSVYLDPANQEGAKVRLLGKDPTNRGTKRVVLVQKEIDPSGTLPIFVDFVIVYNLYGSIGSIGTLTAPQITANTPIQETLSGEVYDVPLTFDVSGTDAQLSALSTMTEVASIAPQTINLNVAAATLSITAVTPTLQIRVGQPVTFEVSFNTEPFTYTNADINARVTVTFGDSSSILYLKDATGGAVISGKTVTWSGALKPLAGSPTTFRFTAVIGSSGKDSAGLPTTLNNTVTASIVDTTGTFSTTFDKTATPLTIVQAPQKIWNPVVRMPAAQ